MADQLQRIDLMPWLGGLSRFGHPVNRRAEGLLTAKNIVYDFDGTKHRRGGQDRLFREPVQEGLAFSDHFLDDSLDTDIWTTTAGDVTFSHVRHSIIRGYDLTVSGSHGTRGQIQASLNDSDNNNYIRSGTPRTINLRTKFIELGNDASPSSANGYFGLFIDDGQATDVVGFKLDIRWGTQGIFTKDTEISAAVGVTDELGAGVSKEYMDSHDDVTWCNWKFIIRGGQASKTLDVHLNGTAIYTGAEVEDGSDGAGAAKVILYWKRSANNLMDVYVDNVEIDSNPEPIRGIAEFRSAETSLTTSRTVFSAGSNMYADIGDPFAIECFDDALPSPRGQDHNNSNYGTEVLSSRTDIKTFNGNVIYASSEWGYPRRWVIGDRRGTVLENAPAAKFIQVHANRLWLAGDDDFPSRIYWSGLLDETVWNPGAAAAQSFSNAGFIDVEPDDGQRIVGVGPSYRGNLIIYKDRSIHRITGQWPDAFARQTLSQTIGGVSHQGIVNIQNDQWFLSNYGVHSLLATEKFGDLDTAFVSREIQDIWDNDVNKAVLETAWMVNNERLDRIDILLPFFVAGETSRMPNRMMSLHYSVRSDAFPEGTWSGPHNITGYSMAMVQYQGADRPRALVGGTDGHVAIQDMPHKFDFAEFLTS
jgi:hypothetical protein